MVFKSMGGEEAMMRASEAKCGQAQAGTWKGRETSDSQTLKSHSYWPERAKEGQ